MGTGGRGIPLDLERQRSIDQAGQWPRSDGLVRRVTLVLGPCSSIPEGGSDGQMRTSRGEGHPLLDPEGDDPRHLLGQSPYRHDRRRASLWRRVVPEPEQDCVVDQGHDLLGLRQRPRHALRRERVYTRAPAALHASTERGRVGRGGRAGGAEDMDEQIRSDADGASSRGPLEDVTVIELGQLLAGPFSGQLLADLGATVIKIEPPGQGDPLRVWGRELVDGEGYWWPIAARNKLSVTCNLREPEGQDIVRRLVADADVLLENFRPGTLERWGLGWDALSAINPALVVIRVSGYGQTGPYATRPGYASVGEAMGGLRHVIGEPDRPPSRAGISIGDSLTAMFGTIGGLAAIHHARRTGEGQVVDASIYESVLAVMESILPEYEYEGYIRERTGTFLPNIAPSNLYPTRDGEWIIVAANQNTLFVRLCTAMDRPELATDVRYADHVSRGQNQAELDALIADWTRTLDAADLLALLEEHQVVAGRIYRAPDMLVDPHFAARESITRVPHPVLGDFPMQNVTPKLSATPGSIRWVGPPLGAHTDQILEAQLGMSAAEIEDLRSRGVV